jgi:hypothetical protein
VEVAYLFLMFTSSAKKYTDFVFFGCIAKSYISKNLFSYKNVRTYNSFDDDNKKMVYGNIHLHFRLANFFCGIIESEWRRMRLFGSCWRSGRRIFWSVGGNGRIGRRVVGSVGRSGNRAVAGQP